MTTALRVHGVRRVLARASDISGEYGKFTVLKLTMAGRGEDPTEVTLFDLSPAVCHALADAINAAQAEAVSFGEAA